jgi:hypothetical protein
MLSKKIINPFLFFLSSSIFFIGILIFSIKFSIPWFGSNDFINYHNLVISPFINDEVAPFKYRYLTPLFAKFLLNFNFLFQENTNFTINNTISSLFKYQIYQSFIFVNYIFLNLSLVILFCIFSRKKFAEIELKNINYFIFLLLILFFLSPFSLYSLTGNIDGVSIFFLSLLCYLFMINNYYLFFLFIILSSAQREIIPLLFLIFLIIFFPKKFKYIFCCLLTLCLYFIFIIYINPSDCCESQLTITGIIKNLISIKFDLNLIKHVFIFNYPVVLLIIIIFIKKIDTYRVFMFYLSIFVFGVLMGVGNNIGRIIFLTFPFYLLLINQDKNKVSYNNF